MTRLLLTDTVPTEIPSRWIVCHDEAALWDILAQVFAHRVRYLPHPKWPLLSRRRQRNIPRLISRLQKLYTVPADDQKSKDRWICSYWHIVEQELGLDDEDSSRAYFCEPWIQPGGLVINLDAWWCDRGYEDISFDPIRKIVDPHDAAAICPAGYRLELILRDNVIDGTVLAEVCFAPSPFKERDAFRKARRLQLLLVDMMRGQSESWVYHIRDSGKECVVISCLVAADRWLLDDSRPCALRYCPGVISRPTIIIDITPYWRHNIGNTRGPGLAPDVEAWACRQVACIFADRINAIEPPTSSAQ